MQAFAPQPAGEAPALRARFATVRAASEALIAPLSPEDCVVQSMPDASPAKWHLAHTSWFFERFVLREHAPAYRAFAPHSDYLWNSYYEAVGTRHERPRRGLLTRPSLDEVLRYREHVDGAVLRLLDAGPLPAAAVPVLALGLAHEEQHQELLVTDAKHLLAQNPLQPAYRPREYAAAAGAPELRFVERPGGLVAIGVDARAGDGTAFHFDNESPRHRAWLEPFALANRPVTNGEFREFVRAGGYRTPALWLSDGWAVVQAGCWSQPLYWQADLESEFTLAGLQPLDPERPACHLSYYEADAFARWAGARLPTEVEWESVAAGRDVAGHFADSGELQPRGAVGAEPFAQLWGDVWEWTASPYVAYPGYRPAAGALGEYNGKFMCNQLVLRGGSCATPPGHVRASYRNFFPPQARWQFAGVRLAREVAC